jgi:hypothetical protein
VFSHRSPILTCYFSTFRLAGWWYENTLINMSAGEVLFPHAPANEPAFAKMAGHEAKTSLLVVAIFSVFHLRAPPFYFLKG